MDQAPRIWSRTTCRHRVRSPRPSNGFRFCFVSFRVPPHFQLPAQNPMEQAEQTDGRSHQNNCIENKDVDLDAEITFLRSEEHVRSTAPPIIALLHFGVRTS